MKVTILGMKASETKSKRMGYTYYFQKPFTGYVIENAECRGFAVGSEYSYTDFKLQTGDIVNLIYEPGYENKATLADVEMIKPYENKTADNKTAEKK